MIDKKLYMKKWRQVNRLHVKEYKRKWNKENKDIIRIMHRRWREKNGRVWEHDHPYKVKEMNNKQYNLHKEENLERSKRYYKEHPEQHRIVGYKCYRKYRTWASPRCKTCGRYIPLLVGRVGDCLSCALKNGKVRKRLNNYIDRLEIGMVF